MNDLCEDLLLHIFSFIDDKDKFVLPRVCRKWRQICTTMTIDHIKWADYKFSIDVFISMLQRFKSVKSLVLDPDGYLPTHMVTGNAEDEHLIRICNLFPNLISINLKFTDITYEGIKIMMLKCKKLKHIYMDNSMSGGLCGPQLNNLIETYPNLKSLSLVNVGEIYQCELPALSNCLELEYLNLQKFELTDQGILEILDKCKCLKTLDISNSNILWCLDSPKHAFMLKKFKEYDVEIYIKIDIIDSINLSRITIDNGSIFIDDELIWSSS